MLQLCVLGETSQTPATYDVSCQKKNVGMVGFKIGFPDSLDCFKHLSRNSSPLCKVLVQACSKDH